MPGTLVITTLSDGTNSTSATNPIKGSALVWVNFVGSSGSVNAQYNVSSVTRNGTGDYTINFTNAMVDTNYAIAGACKLSTFGNADVAIVGFYRNTASPNLTTSARINTTNTGGSAEDPTIVTFIVHR
jgi:hypothetical protein